MRTFYCINCKKSFTISYYITKKAQEKKKFCSHKCAASKTKSNLGSYLLGVRGENNHRWNGGQAIQGGYVYLLKPGHPFANRDGYVKRSRLVMEKKVKRVLMPQERVHHKNKIKTDDRISNLVLFENESLHQKLGHVGEMASNWKGGKYKLICKRCGSPFNVYNYRKNKAKFCSYTCSNRRGACDR